MTRVPLTVLAAAAAAAPSRHHALVPPSSGEAAPSYPAIALADPAAPKVLGATELPCGGKASMRGKSPREEAAALFARLEAACKANPNLRLSINVFDADAHGATVEAGGLRCAPAEAPLPLPSCAERELVTTVEGMKALYWKRVLTPAATAAYEFVWLFDNDIAADELDLAALARVVRDSGVPLIQPRIKYQGTGADLHQFAHLRAETAPPAAECAAVSTNYIDPQTPFMSAEAWAFVHAQLLGVADDKVLYDTDWGIPDHWCRLLSAQYLGANRGGKACVGMEYTQPACAVATTVVRNFDQQTIAATGGNNRVNNGEHMHVYLEALPGCMWQQPYEGTLDGATPAHAPRARCVAPGADHRPHRSHRSHLRYDRIAFSLFLLFFCCVGCVIGLSDWRQRRRQKGYPFLEASRLLDIPDFAVSSNDIAARDVVGKKGFLPTSSSANSALGEEGDELSASFKLRQGDGLSSRTTEGDENSASFKLRRTTKGSPLREL